MTPTVLTPPDRALTGAPLEVDERAARRALKAQLRRLEAELGALTEAGPARPVARRRAAPRLLSLAELERSRDELSDRIRAAQLAAAEQATAQQHNRRLREEMLLDPAAHRYIRVTNEAIGEPGCRDWHVRPRYGLLGMLMNWWRVVVSSGCP